MKKPDYLSLSKKERERLSISAEKGQKANPDKEQIPLVFGSRRDGYIRPKFACNDCGGEIHNIGESVIESTRRDGCVFCGGESWTVWEEWE